MHILETSAGKSIVDSSTETTLCRLLECMGDNPLRENIENDIVGRKIIVIGASAGGIAAIKELLNNLPKDINASILIAIHLSPDHKTLLDAILERDSGFVVQLAQNGDLLLPGIIHLIPPSKNLEVKAGRIHISDQVRLKKFKKNKPLNIETKIPHPIDILFSSVAEQYGRKAIGVILSGSGNDGTRGAKALQEVGGIVLAQSPESSEFSSMPQTAIDENIVNRVLPPDQIARFISVNVDAQSEYPEPNLDESDVAIVENILDALARQGFNFTLYKRKTVINRILRRKALLELDSLSEYFALVNKSSNERHELKNDLLICVTEFFRDADAWDILRTQVDTELLKPLLVGETLRVWIPGCATGEEAYSVAIMLHELCEKRGIPSNYKIFATDLSEESVGTTTQGLYKSAGLKCFDDDRIRKYFRPSENSFQVRNFIREKVISTVHNLIDDAPFTNIHLVCCRNVIIYMQPELQAHVLKILHFALLKDGLLFLGPSESTGPIESEFKTKNRQWNIHSKRYEKKIPLYLDSNKITSATTVRKRPAKAKIQSHRKQEESIMYRKGIEALCHAQKKTALILSGRREVELVVCDPVGLLKVARGQPDTSIEKLLVNSLVPTVIVNLQQLNKLEQDNIVYKNIKCFDNHHEEVEVDMEVHRLTGENDEHCWLLTCQRSSESAVANGDGDVVAGSSELATTAANSPHSQNDLIDTRNQLEETRKVLFDTVKELEKSNQEQQDAFEQLTAANEELQSTNEELQSVNEELYTVNFEYQSKIHELSDLTNDMDNLMRCTDVGVVFIDSNLTIRRFTEQAANIADLNPAIVGSPVSIVAQKLNFPEIETQISHVISLGKSYECDIEYYNCPGRLHIGIHPYKIDSEFSQGAILTMLDLANLKSFSVDASLAREEPAFPD